MANPARARLFFFGYGLFILYGCFIPFRVNLDREACRARFAEAFGRPIAHARATFSIPDAASNVALFLPFGALFVLAWPPVAGRARGSRAALRAAVIGGIFGVAIEVAEAVFPLRTVSLGDSACNALGSCAGAIVAARWFLGREESYEMLVRRAVRAHPELALLAALVAASAADAFYPFDVTLDVSTVWGNVKRAMESASWGAMDAAAWSSAVRKVLLFGGVGYLATRLGCRWRRQGGLALACLGTAALAVTLEGGKLFFVGRTASIRSLEFALVGAMLGAAIASWGARNPRVARVGLVLVPVVVVIWMAVEELAPFAWAHTAEQIAARVARVEWVPFKSYYMADPMRAAADLAKKVAIGAAIGFALAWAGFQTGRHRRPAAIAATVAFLALAFEALQIVETSHTPAVTDVGLFVLGSWFGARVQARYPTAFAPVSRNREDGG